MRRFASNAALRVPVRALCAGAVAVSSVATVAGAQEYTPADAPDSIHDPDGPVSPADLARGDIEAGADRAAADTVEVAAGLRLSIALMPISSDGSPHQSVTVEVRGDTIHLAGFVQGIEELNGINDIVRGIDGLHANQIDNHIVMQ